MTYEETKEYLSIILDMEKNIYIQRQTITKLENEFDSLGKAQNIKAPSCKNAYGDYGGAILSTGRIIGIIGGIITMIILFLTHKINILSFFGWILVGTALAFVEAFVGGLIIGPIIEFISVKRKQNEYNKYYRLRLKEYDDLISRDKERVKKELFQKRSIYPQIKLLLDKYNDSKQCLRKLYDYNIIYPKYQNIIAVASFFEYFDSGRCNQLTGHGGAYDVYENEIKFNRIVNKLDLVIEKLDKIADNQLELANVLYQANKKIDSLNDSVVRASQQISSSIENQTAIQSYNAERTQAELNFMNTMNIIYKWH